MRAGIPRQVVESFFLECETYRYVASHPRRSDMIDRSTDSCRAEVVTVSGSFCTDTVLRNFAEFRRIQRRTATEFGKIQMCQKQVNQFNRISRVNSGSSPYKMTLNG